MAYKLLLADDSITIQKVVGIIFSNEDYELTIVDNGAAAVDKAKEILPDLMLLDAIMPGKNGYEVCEEVRRDPRLAAVPILLLTGVFEPFDEEKAKRSGADDYISKPFESQHLLDKVKGLVEIGRGRAAASPAAPQAPAFETPAFSDAFAAAAEPAFASMSEEADEPAAPSSWDAAPLEDISPEPPVAEPEPSFASLVPEEEGAGIVVEELSESENHADVVPLTADDLVEAAPEASGDDLWGALELEEPAEEGESDFGIVSVEEPVVSAFAPSAAPSFTAQEPAGFESPWVSADEGVPLSEEPVPGAFAPPQSCEPLVENVWEESPVISALDEPESPALSSDLSEPAVSVPTWSIKDEVPPFVGFDEEPAPADEPVFAPEEECVPAPESFAAAAALAVEPAQGSATVTLSEEQLASVVAKISKEVIERIAWEVVPDLAEALIKDEIRKITGTR